MSTHPEKDETNAGRLDAGAPSAVASEAAVAVLRHFGGVGADFSDDGLTSATMTMDALRRYVSSRIAQLLKKRPEYLMSILYRIDVAEADVKAVFASADAGMIPERLADLAIARQFQKLQIRRRYSRKHVDPDQHS